MNRKSRKPGAWVVLLFLGASFGLFGADAPRTSGPVLLEETVVWSEPYHEIARTMDWSGYDRLELTFFNSGTAALPLVFEVKDNKTDSYWTRVNLPKMLGPGLQTIHVPTRLRVGETGRPGRPLDSKHITSLVVARQDQKDRTRIEIRRVELKKIPPPDSSGIVALDVGPEDTAVFEGFQPLTEKSAYDRARGWGWVEKKLWEPYPQANRLFGPDSLTADNFTLASAKLRVDLKPGKYKVWMILDHPGGFWGEYPYYERRTVRAGGKTVLDERQTPYQAKEEFYRWEDAEDRESDDLFERYWSGILKEKSFEAQVTGDHLELEFENHGCPARLPCFGLALSAVVIFPVDSAGQAAAGERWLKDVRERRRAEFHSQFLVKAKPLTSLLASMGPGLQIKNASASLPAGEIQPGAAESPARISALRNTRAFFAPLVSWKGKGPRTVRWKIEGLPEDISVEGGWIRFRALRDSYTGNLYAVKERWATDEKERVFSEEDLSRLWLRFPVGKKARPGTHRATLVLSATGAGAETARLPFELRVFKSEAPELDFPLGPFLGQIKENWWEPALLRNRMDQLDQASLAKMRAAGMTSFSFSPKIGIKKSGSGLAVDTSAVELMMEKAKKLGFQALVGYDAVFEGENLCAKPGRDSLIPDAKRFQQVVNALEARAKERDWLPLALVICDEPVGDGVGALIKRIENLPVSDQTRRIQWSVTTSLGPHATPELRKLVGLVSLPFLQGFAPEDLKFPWAYYNSTNRRSVGLGLLKLRETSELRYRLMWAWNANSANPYFSFDGREDDLAWCSPTWSARLQCTVDLDRILDQGISDYRIALALKKAAESRPAGKALLDEARSDSVDPDAWREKAGEFLDAP